MTVSTRASGPILQADNHVPTSIKISTKEHHKQCLSWKELKVHPQEQNCWTPITRNTNFPVIYVLERISHNIQDNDLEQLEEEKKKGRKRKKKEFYHNVTIFNTQIASKIKGLKTDLQFQKFNRSTFSSNWNMVMASSSSFPSINQYFLWYHLVTNSRCKRILLQFNILFSLAFKTVQVI